MTSSERDHENGTNQSSTSHGNGTNERIAELERENAEAHKRYEEAISEVLGRGRERDELRDINAALRWGRTRNEEVIAKLRAESDNLRSVLEAVRSQMCWERDRDQLTAGMTQLHESVTQALERNKLPISYDSATNELPRGFYIHRDDWIRIYRGCDLGDSVEVRAYLYPHKAMSSRLEYFKRVEPVPADKDKSAESCTREARDPSGLVAVLETIADQHSGEVGSTKRSDCMAAIADLALRKWKGER